MNLMQGHEHECLIDPQAHGPGEIPIMQPGSTVATSLIEGKTNSQIFFIMNCVRLPSFEPSSSRNALEDVHHLGQLLLTEAGNSNMTPSNILSSQIQFY